MGELDSVPARRRATIRAMEVDGRVETTRWRATARATEDDGERHL